MAQLKRVDPALLEVVLSRTSIFHSSSGTVSHGMISLAGNTHRHERATTVVWNDHAELSSLASFK